MKKQNLKNGVGLAITAGLALLPAVTFAGDEVKQVTGVDVNQGVIDTFLTNLKTVVLGVTMTLAVIVLIYGGIMYMLSAGDATKAGTAKKIITYALIGVAVIAGAYLLVSLIGYAVGLVSTT